MNENHVTSVSKFLIFFLQIDDSVCFKNFLCKYRTGWSQYIIPWNIHWIAKNLLPHCLIDSKSPTLYVGCLKYNILWDIKGYISVIYRSNYFKHMYLSSIEKNTFYTIWILFLVLRPLFCLVIKKNE